MNGRDDANARIDAAYLAELQGLAEWIRLSLTPRRESLVPWEVDLLNRVEKIQEM